MNQIRQLHLPIGMDITSLAATFTISKKSIVTVGGVVQTSEITVNDFTNPVEYTVTSDDGSIVIYTVTVEEVVATPENYFAFDNW